MPLYYFRCSKCFKRTAKILKVDAYAALRPADGIYCSCNYWAPREMTGATSKAMEVLDNGLMARPIERLADAERIYSERAAKHSIEQNGEPDDQPE